MREVFINVGTLELKGVIVDAVNDSYIVQLEDKSHVVVLKEDIKGVKE